MTLSGVSGYLNANLSGSSDYWWSMSPSGIDPSIFAFQDYMIRDWSVSYGFRVRPVVSLKAGTKFSGGTGIATDPYVVE